MGEGTRGARRAATGAHFGRRRARFGVRPARGTIRAQQRHVMNLEYTIGLVLAVVLCGYLTYALLRPERF